jgi:hypothetical protein
MTSDSWPEFSIVVLIVTVGAYMVRKAVGATLEAFGYKVGEQAAAEVLKRIPTLAQRIVEWGVRSLPVAYQDRYRQEWFAELEAKANALGEDSPLSLLAEAMRFASAAPRMAPQLRNARPRIAPVTVAFRAYVAVVCLAVAVFLPAGITHALATPGTALLWIVLIAATNFRSVPTLPRVDVTTTVEPPVTVAASVLLPLPLAVFVTLAGKFNEREFRRGTTSPWNIAFNRAKGACTAAAAAYAASLVASVPAGSGAAGLRRLVLATAVAGIVYLVVDTAAVTAALTLSGRLDLRQAAKSSAAPVPHFALDFALITGLGLLIVVLYDQVSSWSVLLLVPPLWLGYNALLSARRSEDRENELTARVRELEMLHKLGTELLTIRRREQVESIGNAALQTVLDSNAVQVSLDGQVLGKLDVIKIPGSDSAMIAVPADMAERPKEVVKAVAVLLGLTLQRLELERPSRQLPHRPGQS